MVFAWFKERPRGSGSAALAGRLSPGAATTLLGFLLATGIAVGATTTAAPRPAGPTPAQVAQVRAAVVAALAARAASQASATPAAVATVVPPQAPATSPVAASIPPTPATTSPAPAGDDAKDGANAEQSPTDDGDSTDDAPADETPATTPLPAITNVWVITLPGESINALSAEAGPASIVRDAIAPQGVLLAGYSLLSQQPAANLVAMLSGQPPNAATDAGCPDPVTDVPPTSLDAATGIVSGAGCRYPPTVATVATQLIEGGAAVRSYAPAGPTGCAGTTGPPSGRLPFAYFHGLTDDPAACADRAADDGRLQADLADPASTPVLSWIVAPDAPAAAAEYAAGALASITASPRYASGGLVLILPDAPDPARADDLAVGAIAVSPFIRQSTRSETAFGPYGVARLLQDLFTLPALAGAGADGVPTVDRSIFQAIAAGARVHHQPTRSSS